MPGIITGHFGDSPFKLNGYFQRGPDYFFEQAEIIGDLCGQGLRAEVSAADGGLGSTSTVVAEAPSAKKASSCSLRSQAT